MKRTAKTILFVVVASTGILWFTGTLGELLGWNAGPAAITVGNETTFITEPLRPDGTVDYIATVNAPLAEIKPDDNAAVLLAKAIGPKVASKKNAAEFFRLLKMDPPPEQGEYLTDLDDLIEWKKLDEGDLPDQYKKLQETWWSKTDNPIFAELLRLNEAPLKLVVEASRRPKFAAPLLSENDPPVLMSAFLDVAFKCRTCARLLSLRAMSKASNGDAAGALEDIDACHRLATLVGRSGPPIQQLIGMALRRTALQADRVMALSGRLPAEELRRRAKVVATWPEPFDLRDAIGRWERLMLLDAISVALLHGVDRAFPGNPAATALRESPKLGQAGCDEALRTINAYFDRMTDAVSTADRTERKEAFAKLETDTRQRTHDNYERNRTFFPFRKSDANHPRGSNAAAGQRMGESVAYLHAPAMFPLDGAVLSTRALTRQTVLAYSLAAYKKRKGGYPAKLDATVLDVPPETLIDPFTDKPFVDRIENGNRQFVSVGLDGILGPKFKPGDKNATAADLAAMPPVDDIVLQLP